MKNSPEFKEALDFFLMGVNKLVDEANLAHPREIKVSGGRKYLKLANYENGSDRPSSVYCFIDTTNGDVLKAASWNAPAKHARGNLFDESNGLAGMSWTGAAYLR